MTPKDDEAIQCTCRQFLKKLQIGLVGDAADDSSHGAQDVVLIRKDASGIIHEHARVVIQGIIQVHRHSK